MFGNLEYEVDELRRDAQIVRRVIASREASDVDSWRGTVDYVKDFVVVGPGEVLTKVCFSFCLLSGSQLM